MSEMIVNSGREVDFLEALLHQLAGPGTMAAIWFYQPVNLPVTAEALGGPSPFVDSSAILAGDGYLVELAPATAESLEKFFAQDLDALSALIHVEIEVAGELQFRSYDSLSINLPGPMLTPEWQHALVQKGIISFR